MHDTPLAVQGADRDGDSRAPVKPALFLDFDGTITLGDVLDRVIERFSTNDAWRAAEDAWQAGTITTRECLVRQLGGVRVTPDALAGFVRQTAIEPAFAQIVSLARARAMPLVVVSDNFHPVIEPILAAHGFEGVDVRANTLTFDGDRVAPGFPWTDSRCSRCAHCKARHLRIARGRPRIFAGDGLSDLCGAEAADIVFAKGTLAHELDRRGVAHRRFTSLDAVAAFVEEASPSSVR